MKYVVLLVMVLAGIWWLRQQRPKGTDKSSNPRQGPQVMVVCADCGVHVPAHDAVQGRFGVYCSQAHRERLEA